ncbi:unnamed protein product [Oppiella nova]|uniref:RING-type domain-containing protein n=1 Tax=Oppiella nova TaxID=334625 RepID=A0A7R9LZQ7_9ACAR|nr:unnamed protein product [Oppiella nova]CAG2167931.1 unnamed protein product [Oppiella nova]
MGKRHGYCHEFRGHGCPALFAGQPDPRSGLFGSHGPQEGYHSEGHHPEGPSHGLQSPHGVGGGPEVPGHGWGPRGHGCPAMSGQPDPRTALFGGQGPHEGYHGWGRRGHGFHGFHGHHGHRGGHHVLHGGHWGYGFGGPRHWLNTSSSSSSSDSSSDSDGEDKKQKKQNKKNKKCAKKEAKKCKKQAKKWHKMRHWMADQYCNKTQCTLCWRQIQPLVDTEVLECGHIYHRLCLKELFQLTLNDEHKTVVCVQCKQQIDDKLVEEFQKRINGQTSDENAIPPENISEEFENLKVID